MPNGKKRVVLTDGGLRTGLNSHIDNGRTYQYPDWHPRYQPRDLFRVSPFSQRARLDEIMSAQVAPSIEAMARNAAKKKSEWRANGGKGIGVNPGEVIVDYLRSRRGEAKNAAQIADGLARDKEQVRAFLESWPADLPPLRRIGFSSWVLAEQVPDDLLDTAQVSKLTGYHDNSLRKWMRAGRFPRPAQRRGQTPYWRLSDVEEWIETRREREEESC